MEAIDLFLLFIGVFVLFLIGFILTLFFGKQEIDLVRKELDKTKIAFHDLQEESFCHDAVTLSAKQVGAVGLLVVDRNQRVVMWNKKFLVQWDLSHKNVEENSTWEYITQYFALHYDADIQRALIQEIMRDRTRSLHDEIVLLNGTILKRDSTPLIDQDGVYHGRLWEFTDVTEHIRREQDLVVAQKKLEMKNDLPYALLEASVHGDLFVDSHWRVVTFNKLFREMWDLSEDMLYIGADGYEVLKYCMKKMVHSDEFMANANKIVDTPDIVLNMQVSLLNGKRFFSASSPVHGLDGIYYGRLWEVTDITDSVQREQDLVAVRKDVVEKHDLLHTLLDAATHGILAVDSQWRVITFNKIFCEMWDLAEDVVYVGADGIEIIRSYCMKQMRNSDIFVSGSRNIFDALNMFWNNYLYLENNRVLKSFSAPIIGLDGSFNGRIWEVTDITSDLFQQQELERSYAALIQKENQLTLALAGAGEGLWTWETRTNIFTLNSEFADQYRSLYEAQPIDQFFSPLPSDEQEQYLNLFYNLTENARIAFEFQLQTKAGAWRWLILRGIVSDVDDDGCPLTVTGILMDITERKQSERHLREFHQKMLVLSQITRHDIVNQLNNLFFLADALSDIFYDPPPDTSSVKHLFELINQSLATVKHQVEFSKDYQELGSHRTEWQDLNACLEKIRVLLIHPPVELLADELPMIYTDPLLEKAVYNLIENSLRHGERVTIIKVTFSVEDGYTGTLTFEDNGVGVPDVDKNRIFDKDFGTNTGLGLFLIREFFSLADMTIYECGTPGQGARFEIKIPDGSWKW